MHNGFRLMVNKNQRKDNGKVTREPSEMKGKVTDKGYNHAVKIYLRFSNRYIHDSKKRSIS